jgi:hypothetical protein
MAKVLHASGSGYFPNCIQQGSTPTSPSVDQYIPITLEEAMFIFWKGKDLKLSIAGFLQNAPNDFPEPGFGGFKDTVDSKNQTFSRGIESESDLVCYSAAPFAIHACFMPITYITSLPSDPGFTPFPGGGTVEFSLGLATNPQNTISNAILANNNTFYARIQCGIPLNFNNASVGPGFAVVGQISISFGGQNYSVPLRTSESIGFGSLNINAEWTSTYEYQD